MESISGVHDLVIARYNESLDWVLQVPDTYRVHIYNKGDATVSPEVRERAETFTALRNAGRESDTYLTHMLEYGPGTGEFTVFSQGDPCEHSPDFLALLATPDRWSDVQTLTWWWKAESHIPPPILLTPERSILQGLRAREELFALNTFQALEWVDIAAESIGREYRLLHRLPEGVNIAAHFLEMCELPEIADQAAQHVVGRYGIGAIFGVRTHLIEKLPTRAMVRLRQAAMGPAPHGFFCEKLWLHIFGEPFMMPLAPSM
ncbi:hypothetical protein [Nocardia sp. XZ_19_385]|uniref:hypothetical protein n=1 Tax=Nocardia sp. XZ_19_385 TaxID=2769488 RepID=UPI00188F6FBA|nr:hypothetical protein [Nocardia sp. XZ_19_385]